MLRHESGRVFSLFFHWRRSRKRLAYPVPAFTHTAVGVGEEKNDTVMKFQFGPPSCLIGTFLSEPAMGDPQREVKPSCTPTDTLFSFLFRPSDRPGSSVASASTGERRAITTTSTHRSSSKPSRTLPRHRRKLYSSRSRRPCESPPRLGLQKCQQLIRGGTVNS